MALLYIGLSILCSLMLAQVLKWAESKELGVLRILVLNYLSAFFISLLNSDRLLKNIDPFDPSPVFLVLIITLGLGFIANLIIYSRSIHRIGMGISIAAMRMSLIFPIAVSLFVFGENIAVLKYLGIFLALISLLFMLPQVNKNSIRRNSDFWLPILIFFMTGFTDTGMKIYEEIYSHKVSEHVFLGGIFLVSFATGMVVLIQKKDLRFTIVEGIFGITAGIVNLYASVFLIKALKLLPGSVVFPLINVTLVVAGTFIGIWFWKDKLTIRQGLGLGIAIISILLLI